MRMITQALWSSAFQNQCRNSTKIITLRDEFAMIAKVVTLLLMTSMETGKYLSSTDFILDDYHAGVLEH